MNTNLSLMEDLAKARERIGAMEEILGKGLNMPFNPSNSGARKILYATQSDHIVPLKHPEVPLVQTGYEIRFGDLSASMLKADTDLVVAAIIPKFSFLDKYNYYMILRDDEHRNFRLVHRISYEHTTECYGYMYNTTAMDKAIEQSKFYKGDVLRKSTSYDDYENRIDGTNVLVGYIGTDMNMEDSVIISEDASKKFTTSMIKKVTIILNDNNIPLNIHGTSDRYKCLPDIGENIEGGILFASRLEKKEEAIYTQSFDRLSKPMISDEKFTIEGRVEDIDIYCNNPEILQTNFCNMQLYMYYNEKIRMYRDIVGKVDHLRTAYPNYQLDYDLQKLYFTARKIIDGGQYIRDGKVFSNTVIEVTVVEEAPLRIGDKISDRYGGKGVISAIWPNDKMPKTDLGEPLDVILSPAGVPNRENMGQVMETSITHVGTHLNSCLRKLARTGKISSDEAFKMIYDYVYAIVPEEAEEMDRYISKMDDDTKDIFVQSIIDYYAPCISTRPITDNLTIDKIANLYHKFPWITQSYLEVPIEDSNGNVRYIKSKRPIVAGRKYMFRLKQFAEEKFSVTSLSSVNIKNQNTRSKASKNYKARFTNTPVNMGDMETGDLLHMGAEYVISDLMIHSVSPQARRLCETMLTGDPIDVNIRLDGDSKNRSVEMVNTYLKAKGLQLCFRKFKKVSKPLISYELIQMKPTIPLITMTKPGPALDKYYEQMKRVQEMQAKQLIRQDLITVDHDLTPSMKELNEIIDQYYIDKENNAIEEEKQSSILDDDI